MSTTREQRWLARRQRELETVLKMLPALKDMPGHVFSRERRQRDARNGMRRVRRELVTVRSIRGIVDRSVARRRS